MGLAHSAGSWLPGLGLQLAFIDFPEPGSVCHIIDISNWLLTLIKYEGA